MDFKTMTQEELAALAETLTAKVTNLETNLAAVRAELEGKKDELALTIEVNQELVAQVEKLSKAAPVVKEVSASTNAISGETFQVENSTYGFSYPKMHHKGSVITATEVLASEDLQRELVGMGSGMIKLMSVDMNK